jgi:acetyl esterase
VPSPIVRLAERLEHGAARAVIARASQLAPYLPRRLGRVADGVPLDPELRVLLALRELTGSKPLSSQTVDSARAQITRESRVHGQSAVAVAEVRELSVPGPGGALPARLYRAPRDRGPLLVFFHGGGFVVGDLDSHDLPCRVLCQRAGVHVLSVAYRLAPEHPFPAAIDDGVAAYLWAREHAAELGADPERVAVGGDSAGGNLAAVLSILVRDRGLPPPVFQLLLYPSVDRANSTASLAEFDDGLFLTRSEVEWYTAHYLGDFCDRHDFRISPLLAPSLAALPPALVVTAGFDPLRDEGEAYAEALEAAGTPAALYRAAGLVHGFINMGAVSPACLAALEHVAGLLRARLGP